MFTDFPIGAHFIGTWLGETVAAIKTSFSMGTNSSTGSRYFGQYVQIPSSETFLIYDSLAISQTKDQSHNLRILGRSKSILFHHLMFLNDLLQDCFIYLVPKHSSNKNYLTHSFYFLERRKWSHRTRITVQLWLSRWMSLKWSYMTYIAFLHSAPLTEQEVHKICKPIGFDDLINGYVKKEDKDHSARRTGLLDFKTNWCLSSFLELIYPPKSWSLQPSWKLWSHLFTLVNGLTSISLVPAFERIPHNNALMTQVLAATSATLAR